LETWKVPVAGREERKTATRAICLRAEQAAADKDQRKRDSNNQCFSHFYLLKILIVVNAGPEIRAIDKNETTGKTAFLI
jgi:hypothetical protein